MESLPILVVVDVDPDWRVPGAMRGSPHGKMSWNGFLTGVPRMLESVRGLRDTGGRDLRFTWMLRSDDQMGMVYGDPAYVGSEFADFWHERLSLGDEIGWHPHLWRYSEADSVWFQECSDSDWISSCFREGFAALNRMFPVRCAKSGWTYHDNSTMQILADLGIRVDLSALPGMRFEGAIQGTSHPVGRYDWSRAPQEPYHPRPDDYQAPGNGRALPILEVPNWTFRIGPLRRALHAVRGRSWRDFANPAKHPWLVNGGFRKPPRTVPYVCYLHPEELLRPNRVFDVDYVARNLHTVLDVCASRGVPTKASVASELIV